MNKEEQFKAFVLSYQDMVYSTAVRLLGNSADAEDIAQEVFIKAYEYFPEFKSITNVGGWLRRIAVNLALNHLSRYRARWSFFSEIVSDERGGGFEIEYVDESASLPEENERRRILDRLLMSLPPKQRVPLVLYHYEGLSYEEIAERLGVSLGKVKTDIHRGREALKRLIQSQYGKEDGISPERARKSQGREVDDVGTRLRIIGVEHRKQFLNGVYYGR